MSRRRTFRKSVPDAKPQDPKDEILRAKRKAVYLLADMDRTETELRKKLSGGGFSAPAVEEAVRYVRRFGYIDDARYAEHYAETASAKKSRTQIRFDLQKKGLSRELIDGALDRLEMADEKPLIRSLIGKKLRSGRSGDPHILEKAAAACARKGFSASDIRAVLSEYRESMEEDLP